MSAVSFGRGSLSHSEAVSLQLRGQLGGRAAVWELMALLALRRGLSPAFDGSGLRFRRGDLCTDP